MKGIIDSHIHRYPDEVAADPLAWAAARGEARWAELVAPGGLQGWASRDRLLRDMDAAGVDEVVIQGWYWEHQSTCDQMNAWHARWVREDPDRIIALAAAQPREAGAAEGVRRALDAGLSGVGELHPGVQGWDFSSAEWGRIADLCEERGLPVCFHATESAGHDYKGRVATPLEAFAQLAASRPSLKLVLAHWGGGMPFFEMNRRMRKTLANVFYDTAASPLLYDASVWANVAAMVGEGKVLFGSDYPLRVFPARQKEPDFAMLVAQALANLPEPRREAVMRRNALRVYSASR
jgi:hypothetical protein